ncbi:MAG TPA: hypothetical protein PLB18_20495 [Acidobacteriota bacterium]|nr:hypothetical protein [Acidobacteriota bacterium]HNB70185.1 hypothetical protein [Acidobacteriota bacterium]HNC43750.1 hypothetical protein [Acidobacteriota bacterium]HND21759.1 hypothetical protein [Acidobacteriota bacterium]HNG91508.1 hypothetical protein [Acidobacteriota bacterium]
MRNILWGRIGAEDIGLKIRKLRAEEVGRGPVLPVFFSPIVFSPMSSTQSSSALVFQYL